MDREFSDDGQGWEITDGSAGIRGEVLRADTLAEVKLFLATARSGLAQGFQQTRSTIFGSQLHGSLPNAGLAATGKAIDAYAELVLGAIKRVRGVSDRPRKSEQQERGNEVKKPHSSREYSHGRKRKQFFPITSIRRIMKE